MDKEARGKLLRQRARKKAVPRCIPANPSCLPTGRPFLNSISFTVAQHAKELPVFSWLHEENPKPDTLTPQTRRTARKSALQRIAERWDERKLAERLSRH